MKKVLVITGGSSGIGYAAAEIFQSNNYEIINISRSEIPLKNAIHISADLSKQNLEQTLPEELQNNLSGADQVCLIHNACNMRSDNVENADSSSLREVFEVNLVAPLIINRIVIPYMKKGSSILYVGSTLSEKAVPQMASYVSSKHGMIGLMRSTCQDLHGRFIHTACICPGATDTEMLNEYTQGNEEALKMMAEKLSENRLITSPEIAETLYFCSQNSVINGALVHANLGILDNT